MYLLVKDNTIITNGSLDAIKSVIINRENFKITSSVTSEGESWKLYAHNKELPYSYSARIDDGGYTLEEVKQDLTAESLARWFNYSIYKKL